MPIGTILGLVLPVVSKFLMSLMDRAWNNGVSSLQGVASGAAILGLFQLMGCDMSLAQQASVAMVGSLPGLLASDPKNVVPGLFDAAKSKIEQAKHSAQVLADAQAAQDAALPPK